MIKSKKTTADKTKKDTTPIKEVEKESKRVDPMNPPFDPDIPEQKQRWFR